MAIKDLIVPGFVGTTTVKHIVTRGLSSGSASVTVSSIVASGVGATVAGTTTTQASTAGTDFTTVKGKFNLSSEPRSNTHTSADKVWKSEAKRGTNLAIWDKNIPAQGDWTALSKHVSVILKLTARAKRANAGLVINYNGGKYLSVELNHNKQALQVRYHDGTHSSVQLTHPIKLRRDLVRYKLTVDVIPTLSVGDQDDCWIKINVQHVGQPDDKYPLGTSGEVNVDVPLFKVKNFNASGTLNGYFGIVSRYATSTFDEFTVDNYSEANDPATFGNDFSSAFSSAYDKGHITPTGDFGWHNPQDWTWWHSTGHWDVLGDGKLSQTAIDTLQTWIDTHGTSYTSAFSNAFDYDSKVFKYPSTFEDEFSSAYSSAFDGVTDAYQVLVDRRPEDEPYVDINNDGMATSADVKALTEHFQQHGPLTSGRRWQNSKNAFDVTNNGCVDYRDLDIIEKWLQDGHAGVLPSHRPSSYPYLDVDGDGSFTINDAKVLFNYLSQFGESCKPTYSLSFSGAFK